MTLVTGSQLLLGHPEAFWISSVVGGLYVLFRLRARPRGADVLALGLSAMLGVLIGSLQMLPTWEAVVASFRAPGMLNPFRSSLPPTNLVQLVAPYLTEERVLGLTFAHEYGLYAGAVATVAAAWLLVGYTGHTELRRIGFGLAVLCFLLALGRYGGVYRLMTYLPVVGQFEHPARYIAGLQLALAILTALAFADLAERTERASTPESHRTGSLIAIVVVSFAVAALALFSGVSPEWTAGDRTRFASTGQILAGPLLITGAASLFWLAFRGSRLALAGIVVLVGIDLGAYGVSYIREPGPVTPQAVFEGQARPPDASGRIQSYNNYLLFGGLQLTGGYAALNPRPILPELHPARLRLLGVRWVQLRTPWGRGPSLSASAADAQSLRTGEVIQTADALGGASDWLRIDNPVARARLVTDVVVSRTPAQDLDAIDIERTALVGAPLDLGPGPPGTLQILEDRPGRLRVAVNASTQQLLVLTETWHEGWTARAGGRSLTCQPAYGAVLSCLVGPGQTEIALRFFPPRLWIAIAAAAAGSIAALTWFVLTRARHGHGWSGA